MQSFTFDELDERGQELALSKYGRDSKTMTSLNSSLDTLALIKRARSEGWRFTEHGERIAATIDEEQDFDNRYLLSKDLEESAADLLKLAQLLTDHSIYLEDAYPRIAAINSKLVSLIVPE